MKLTPFCNVMLLSCADIYLPLHSQFHTANSASLAVFYERLKRTKTP